MNDVSNPEILGPVIALAGWTMLIWLWMYVKRLPAINRSGIDTPNWVGGTGGELDAKLDAKTQWVAHNYNHLHEAPTVFYAMALVLAMIGHGDGMNATIAWVYVALRIVHSLWQILNNRVVVRFALFILSSIALMALTLHAAIGFWH